MQSKDNPPDPEVRISDHAIVRYMERVYGLDLDALRREMLTPDREHMIRMGAKKIKAGDHVFIVENSVVITVLYRKTPDS